MPNIAKDKNDLEYLLYGKTQPSQTTGVKAADEVDAGADDMTQQPVFTFDYESEMDAFRRKCRGTVMSMARHVLTKEMLANDYIKDKIEQDVSTLSELYWARRSNELIKLSIMDSISKGNTMPRMYDSYASICDKVADNNKQIIATENNLRKTYLELKYELMAKEEGGGSAPAKSLPSGDAAAPASDGKSGQMIMSAPVMRGTKDLLNTMKEMMKERMRNEAVDVQPVENNED